MIGMHLWKTHPREVDCHTLYTDGPQYILLPAILTMPLTGYEMAMCSEPRQVPLNRNLKCRCVCMSGTQRGIPLNPLQKFLSISTTKNGT